MKENGGIIKCNEDILANELILLSSQGNLENVKLYTYCGIDMNIHNFDGRNVGHLAAANCHMQVLHFLADNGSFDFLAQDRFG